MQKKANDAHEAADGRREFLKSCGRFAAVTPPAITMLLSTSLTSNAIANSGGGGGGGGGKTKGNNGFGNGGGDGVPGNSGKTDSDR